MSNYSSSNQTLDGDYGYSPYGGSDFNRALEADEAVLKRESTASQFAEYFTDMITPDLPTGAKLASASKLAQTPMLLSAKLVVEFPKQKIGNYFLRVRSRSPPTAFPTILRCLL